MLAQRKVTAFVTNGSGRAAELCVFWHTASGIQVPAGSVESGESFEQAARREAAEETGLTDLELVSALGVRRSPPPAGQAWIAHRVVPRTEPSDDAPHASWTLGQGVVDVLQRHHGYTEVCYREFDVDASDPQVGRARFEGWVPDACVTQVQDRAYFHFRTTVPPPREWRQQAEPEHVFHLRWVPLEPLPTVLVPGQHAWLAEFHSALVSGSAA